MGVFGKVSGAKVTNGGAYFKAGLYRVKIVRTSISDGHKGVYCVVEVKVLASDNAEIKVGQTRSYVIGMSGNQATMGPINVKAFVLPASGVEPTDDNGEEKACALWSGVLNESLSFEEVCERVFDENANLLEGLEMDLECIEIETQKTKRTFTKHLWSPADWKDVA